MHGALIAAGRLAPLDCPEAIEAARWVDGRDWWYETSFDLALAPGERAWLHLERIDYLAELWLDDQQIASSRNAIAPIEVEVTPWLQGQHHHLRVHLIGADHWPEPAWQPWERAYARLARRLHPGKASITPFHPRLGWLRAPMQAGWDFAPRLHATGLPGRVWIERSGPLRIATLQVGAWHFADDGSAHSHLRLTLDSARPCTSDVTVAWTSLADGSHGRQRWRLTLPAGQSRFPLALSIPRARRWHPWEQGAPDRYRLSVSAVLEGKPSSALERTVGLREVQADGKGWRVNGQPLFVRGANWVPADLLPATVSPDRYRTLLTAARDRGINLLRVWGGGGPEQPAFYELCDELGLMLWQEFPFACAFLDHYPRDRDFQQQVSQGARGMVQTLRHHPSILCWGAGNEFSALRNRWLVRTLADAVARDDGTRPMRGPSPGARERHNWHVWHGYAPLHHYDRERAALLSEFGLQAPPSPAALRRMIPPGQLWPPGPAWAARHAELDKLRAYATGETAGDALERFVEQGQAAQAAGVQLAIERMRRRKARGAAGVILWQWNEPWAAISWALLAHDGTPKRAADQLATWYAPQLLSLAFDRQRRWQVGDRFRATLWAINDQGTTVGGCEARLWQGNQRLAAWPLTLPPHSAHPVASVDAVLPGNEPLRLELWHQGTLRLTNRYPLVLPGPQRANPFRWLYRTLAEWVMGV